MNGLLHHERVVPEGRAPAQWLLVLHGLFGSGRNWAGVVRRVVEERPDWGGLLIDLREHGRSTGMAGPDTLESAAADVGRLVASLGVKGAAILGHSFGGKVALRYAMDRAGELGHAFIIDSTPGLVPAESEGGRMLALLRELPQRFGARDEAVNAMVSRGVAKPLAQWMAMNLTRDGEAYRWRMDLGVIERLLDDFRRQDLWAAVESPGGTRFHILRGTRSEVLTPEALARLRRAGPRVSVHEIEGGHWLNVDNPQAVVRIIAGALDG